MRFLPFFVSFFFLASLVFLVSSGGYKEGKRPAAVEAKLEAGDLYTGATGKPVPIKPFSELPESFDWCNVDGRSFCTASWNQHIPKYCGSCYVHGALSQINDRLKIANKGLHDVMMARQVILNCASSHGLGDGCNGGEGFDVFEYMHRYGLPDESCQLYKAEASESCNAEAICQNCMPIGEEIFPFKCWAVKSPILYRVKEYGKLAGEQQIMSEIHARGPVTCGFASTDEFDYGYRGGVFMDRTNATDMNHDVEVVGWGVEADGTKYWKARNSWGTYFGENSFFKVVRGINNMRFEEECTFAIVDTEQLNRVLDHELGGSMYGVVPKGEEPKTLVALTAEALHTELAEIAEDAKLHHAQHTEKAKAEGKAAPMPYDQFYKSYLDAFSPAKGAAGAAGKRDSFMSAYNAKQADYAAVYMKLAEDFKKEFAPGKTEAETDAAYKAKFAPKGTQAEIDAAYKEKYAPKGTQDEIAAAYKAQYAPGASEDEIAAAYKAKFAPGGTEDEIAAAYKEKFAPKGTEAEINAYFKNKFAPGATQDEIAAAYKEKFMADVAVDASPALQAKINEYFKNKFAPEGTEAEINQAYKDKFAPKGTQAEINDEFRQAFAPTAASDRAAVRGEAKELNPDTANGDQYISQFAGKWAGGQSGASQGGSAGAGAGAGGDWQKYSGTYGGDFMKYAGGEAGPAGDVADHPHEAHHQPRRHAHPVHHGHRKHSSGSSDSIAAGGAATTSHINAGTSAASAWSPASGTKDTYGYAKWSNAFTGAVAGGGAAAGGAGGYSQYLKQGQGASNWQKFAGQGKTFAAGAFVDSGATGEPVVNREIYDAILNAYHQERTAVSRDGDAIARDAAAHNAKIEAAIKSAIEKGGESAREIKSSILQAVQEVRTEAATEAARLDESEDSQQAGSEAIKEFQDIKNQVADAVRTIKAEEHSAAAPHTQAAVEIPTILHTTGGSDVHFLSVVSGVLFGGMATAAVIFGMARYKRSEEYEQF